MGDSWRQVKLGEVAELVQRKEPVTPGLRYRQIGIRLWGGGAYAREEIDGSETKYPMFYRICKDDVVVNKIWARSGTVAVVDKLFDGFYGSAEYPTYKIDQSSMVPQWFGWYTRSSALWDQCERLSRGTSSKSRLRPERFLEVSLPLPPLEEQCRIVAWLNGVKARLDDRLAVIEKQEREAEAMLQAAFQRLIENAPYRPMAEAAPLARRQIEIIPDEEYTEIGVKSFYRGVFHRRKQTGLEFSWQNLFLIEQGDLIFSNLMAWEQAIAVAGPNDHGCVGNHRMLTCQADRKIATPDFLLFYFKTAAGFASIVGASPGTIARNKTLSAKLLPTIKVPTPPIDKQHWFDDLQSRVQEIRDLRAAMAMEVDALLPAMLHRVFNGVSGQSG